MPSIGGKGGQLGLRLFLEGIEVPVISAVVQCSLNAPATASIQVVPSDRVLELKPRTLVHLFYYDFTLDDATPPQAEKSSTGGTAQTPTSPLDPLKSYKLLFGGEVIGLAAMKTPSSRQMVLQCADWSTYWDTTYQMFISFAPHGNFLTESSAVWSGGNSLFDDILDGHSAVMNRFLHERPLTEGLKDVKGLMGGIIRLLEAMGGVPNHVHGVNDFFTIAELMRHLLQQITAEQDDDTALQLFDNKEFWQWLEKGTMSMGQLISFRDLLKLLFQWVYYEVVPVTAPMYVPATGSKKVAQAISVAFDFPSSVQEALEELHRAARLAIGSGFAENDQARGQRDSRDLRTIRKTPLLASQVQNKIDKVLVSLDRLAKRAVSSKDRVDEKKDWQNVVDGLLEVVKAGAESIGRTTKRTKLKSRGGSVDRLQTQIFRPDCFFAAPPRCNVFFPDVYTSFSYQRQFLQEPTRLRLQTSWFGSGGDALLADYFYAPSMPQIQELAKKQGNSGIRALLPWEKFTGILPKFEHIAEINYISNKRSKELNRDVRGKATSYSSRAANFNYFKYRFAARMMEVSMRFNPAVVVGFPALLIEKPFIITPEAIRVALDKNNIGDVELGTQQFIDSIDILAKELPAPTQYLGMVASLTHSVDQTSGSTNVTMTHARTHRITEDDFLQALAIEVVKQTNVRDQITVLDARELLAKGDFKLLDLLIKATPQDIPDQMSKTKQSNDQQKQQKQNGKEPPMTLSSRPNPDLSTASLRNVATGLFANVTIPDFGATPVTVTVNTGLDTPLRGKVKETTLTGTRTTILEPDPYRSDISPGKKGPNGGTITQIQLSRDEIIQLTREQINQQQAKSGNKKTAKKKPGSQVVYVWAHATLHEEVKSSTIVSNLPIEEVIRPPWFSPIYSNLFIGDHVYQPFFGIGSIVDEILFQTPQGAGTQGTKKKSELLSQIQAADGDLKSIAEILNDAKASNLSDLPSVETAADILAYVYGETRRLGLDVHRFIADYTSRPIATLEDIFGSVDLQYKQKGDKLERVSGTAGFHSTSVGDYKDLIGLLDNPDQPLPRILTKGKKDPISRTLDPRPARRAQVLAYTASLFSGQGSLGIGLLG